MRENRAAGSDPVLSANEFIAARWLTPGQARFVVDLQMCNQHDPKSCGARASLRRGFANECRFAE